MHKHYWTEKRYAHITIIYMLLGQDTYNSLKTDICTPFLMRYVMLFRSNYQPKINTLNKLVTKQEKYHFRSQF